jgi:hypothetical protein
MDYTTAADPGQQQRQRLQGYGHDQGSSPSPREPGIRARLMELIGYLDEHEKCQAELRQQLCGPSPVGGPESGNKRLGDPSIEELLAGACQKAACLVGEQKSINARL